ncbi:MAG: glycosyltransferase family 2 protein [bacterium]|jgi:glycosyltransferase involved in cell wall biosynthesis|nr:glycosyltransferase family 2 protein [bacterium]
MKVGAILPALNAARFLPQVIGDIRRAQPQVSVLVVDDGSSDTTAETARLEGAHVIAHPRNLGKGMALRTGYAWAQEQGLDWVFTLDSDGQHLPGEMQAFLDAAATGKWDALVGTRMASTSNMPWLRKWTNITTSRVISGLAGCTIPDSQSGYRLYRVAKLRGLRLRTTRYDAESEILVRLARGGARIGAVPISTVYGDQVSSIRPLVDTGRFLRLVALLAFTRDRARGSAIDEPTRTGNHG